MHLMLDFGCHIQLSLATIAILHGDPTGFLVHFGIKCSTWTPVNAGTSGRSACSSIGNTSFDSVLEGNLMASRILCVEYWHSFL